MKNKLQLTRTSFSQNFQCKKAPRWLSMFFSFWYWKSGGPVKKTPCTKAFHAKGAHKKVYQDKAKNCIITPHHISTKCVNMLFLNFSQFWNSLEGFEINQKYPEYFEKFFSHLEISWQIYVSPCTPESFLTFNLLFIICANTFWTHQNLPNKQKLSP